jgi:hypothetical protein
MRHSTIYLAGTGAALALCGLMALHASLARTRSAPALATSRGLVRSLQLTDLCLFTEARYTRHPAMADRHAPFQEHPTAFEHFPSGSLLPPLRPEPRPHAERP